MSQTATGLARIRKVMRNMTLLQLEILKAVVDTGSFTKAGEKLGLTQSAISHAISGLELEFGVCLLNRSRAGIFLTHAGALILSHVREALNQTQQIKQKISAMTGQMTGTIRIGCFSSVAAKILPGILGQFTANYPAVVIEFIEGSYAEIEKFTSSGFVDLGFVLLPNSELEVFPLIQDEYVAVFPEGHPLYKKTFITIPEIAREPFIMPLGGCEFFVRNAFEEAQIKPNIRFEIEHNNTILAMVKSGLGISIVPELIFTPPGIRTVSFTPPIYRKVGLGIRSFKSATPVVRTFIRNAQSWIKSNGYLIPKEAGK